MLSYLYVVYEGKHTEESCSAGVDTSFKSKESTSHNLISLLVFCSTGLDRVHYVCAVYDIVCVRLTHVLTDAWAT